MDADKILANLKQVVPFYQPIFSADTHQVIGYEILGHIKTNLITLALNLSYMMKRFQRNTELKWIIIF